MTTNETTARPYRRAWLADLLGGLVYAGGCDRCGRQFLSRNVFVWYAIGRGTVCDRCGQDPAQP